MMNSQLFRSEQKTEAAPPLALGSVARRLVPALVIAALLLAGAVVLSLAVGARFIPFGEVVGALLGSASPTPADGANIEGIVGTLRVNRTINALLCGAALGLAGVLMQALTRNPIADPGILGVNAGAAFGVVLGLTLFGGGQTVWFAFLGAGLAAGVIFILANSRFVSGSAVRLTLAGVAFSAALSGVTQTLILANESVLDTFRFWRIGSLTVRSAEESLPLIVFIAAGAVLALAMATPLNMLALGDDSATALGVRPGLVRVLVLIAVTLLCGSATAIAGPISFVGLVVPHLIRRVVGPDLRLVLPLSLLVAPALLLLADVIGRVVSRGSEVQVGVIMALIGGPLLMFFVAGKRRGGLA